MYAMPFADADGVRIHYETCGSGNLKSFSCTVGVDHRPTGAIW
jgi:hypothetical protein